MGSKDVVTLLDILAGLRALQVFPWRCFNSLEGRKAVAALATVVGAGVMGAMMLLKGRWLNPAAPRSVSVPGLRNDGNNCFLNAVLQAMSSSPRVMAYLKNQFQDGDTAMPLAAALSELLQELARVAPGRRIISPRKVMLILGCYARNFDLAVEQDAAEALSHLATALQRERMIEFEDYKPTLQSLAAAQELSETAKINCMTRHEEELECWKHSLRWPMEGTIGSLVVCSQCDFQSTRQFQFIRDVPLYLSPSYTVSECSIQDCLEEYITTERVSDVTCSRCAHLSAIQFLSLTSPMNKELIDIIRNCNYDDNCHCESLAVQRGGVWLKIPCDAYKHLRIGRSPEVLCLHIHRVIVNNAGELEKVMAHVSFPMELDIYPFTIAAEQTTGVNKNQQMLHMLTSLIPKETYQISKCVGGSDFHGDIQEERHQTSIEEEEEDEEQVYNKGVNKVKQQQLYDLFSVVVHHGGPTSGHYTVYRKVSRAIADVDGDLEIRGEEDDEDEEEDMWFAISDADVVRVSEKQVLAARATLLFYELRTINAECLYGN